MNTKTTTEAKNFHTHIHPRWNYQNMQIFNMNHLSTKTVNKHVETYEKNHAIYY